MFRPPRAEPIGDTEWAFAVDALRHARLLAAAEPGRLGTLGLSMGSTMAWVGGGRAGYADQGVR